MTLNELIELAKQNGLDFDSQLVIETNPNDDFEVVDSARYTSEDQANRGEKIIRLIPETADGMYL